MVVSGFSFDALGFGVVDVDAWKREEGEVGGGQGLFIYVLRRAMPSPTVIVVVGSGMW